MPCLRRPLLAAGLGLLLGPRLASAAGDAVAGSGAAATQRRELGAFGAVSLGADFSVLLRPAAREGVEVVADDNLLALVETRVRGAGVARHLEIGWLDDMRIEPRTPVVVTVDYVRLEAIAVAGSGRLSGSGVQAAKVDASISGSGTMSLTGLDAGELAVAIGGSGRFSGDGRVRRLAVSIGGSGRCDAERIVADDVSVSLAGSGNARVRAESALTASIVGSGTLFHAGAAEPRISAVGNGRVRRI
jgi:Putative auto-transporter adhesin, head GIN domain